MKKLLLSGLLFFILAGITDAAVITSTAAGGNWNVGATWIGGVVPVPGDDVIIDGPVTQNVYVNIRSLTINAGKTLLRSSVFLVLYGSLTNNGAFNGNGSVFFRGVGSTISGAGSFGAGGDWSIQANGMSIAAGTTIIKPNYFSIDGSNSFTNNGNLTLTSESVKFGTTSASFTAGVSSTLDVRKNITGGGILNLSAVGNTLLMGAAVTAIPVTVGSTFHHLTLYGGGTKTMSANITLNGNLTLNSTTTILNAANFNITLAGNWANNTNSNVSNLGTVAFNGAGAQTITRGSGNIETFNAINVTGTGTVSLADTIRVNGNLTITSGTLDVTASNLSIHCRRDFSDNSVLNARQGRVFMDGTVAQVMDGAANTNFYNLTISNAAGVTVNSAKTVSNILSVQVGSFGPSAAGSVTIPATGATSGGRIGPLGAGASLTGTTWILQTWINGPATAYWQYLGSPTTSSQLSDWDNDTRFYMSGVGGNDGNACCPIFRSVRTYTEATNTYTNVLSTGEALTPGKGFTIWMSDNMTSLTAPLIFDTRGTPNFGNVEFGVTSGGAGGGYNLVSNPYACPVTYSTVVSTSDAVLNGSFLILNESGSYVTDPNGGTIAAAQGFLCNASSGGNIIFTESAKSTTATPNVIRAIAGNQIRITASNEVNGLGEQTTVRLNPMGDAGYDRAIDLPYIASPYDNASHVWTQNAEGAQFILNDIGTSSDHLMIPLSVTTSTPGGQILKFQDLNTVTEYNCAWLEDLTTGERINLNSTDTYSFEEEMGVTRNFILHLERTNDCTFDLQNSQVSLDAQTNVFVNNDQVFASFEFDTEEVVTISMYDLSGRMVMGETTMNVGTETVALSNPDAHGIYLVRIVKGNEVSTKKFYY